MIKNMIAIVVLMTSCITADDQTKKKSSDSLVVVHEEVAAKTVFFRDIDLFSMKGIGQFTGAPVYPCIGIEVIGDTQRNIFYYASEKNGISIEYKKTDSCWIAKYEKDIDSSYNSYYEFVFPTKIVGLTYLNNDHLKFPVLNVVWMYENNIQTSYYMKGKSVIAPDTSAIELARKQYEMTGTVTLTAMDSVVRWEDKTVDRQNKVRYEQTKCYLNEGHSYFYYTYLEGKKLDCAKGK